MSPPPSPARSTQMPRLNQEEYYQVQRMSRPDPPDCNQSLYVKRLRTTATM